MTDREGASIQGNFGIPAKAAIEFEISWKSKPDFVFALAIDPSDMRTLKRAFRFEAWGSDLVIQRELESEADLAVVQEIHPGPVVLTSRPTWIKRQEGSWCVLRAGSNWRA